MSDSFEIIDPRIKPDFDKLLLKSENYSVFHTSYWADVIIKTYNYTPLYIFREIQGQLNCLLPVMLVKSRWTGKRLISLTFSDFCEPIIQNNNLDSFKLLFDKYLEIGKLNNASYLEFNSDYDYFKRDIPVRSIFVHKINLGEPESELYTSFRKGTKSSITKAQKEGITVKINTSESSLHKYYDLHCLTRKRLGLPPQPLHFFTNIFRLFITKKMGFISLAYKDNNCIAGAIYLYVKEKAVYKFSASDHRFKNLNANNLVMWESILYCKDLNLKELHLGRTEELHQGLRMYKKGWGSEESSIQVYKYSLQKNQFIPNSPYSSKISENIFKLLPLPVLKKIGKIAYRHFG